MPNFQHSRFLEQNAVNQLLIPRNDALLSEVSVDDSTFSLAKGPFSSYERSLEVTPVSYTHLTLPTIYSV